jgi:signal transduction histidine kinase
MLVFFWVRPFWRDLHRLHLAAEDVGAGRFEYIGPRRTLSAAAPVRRAFRAMAGRIAALLQSHRTLTSAVSHELRTPLARLRFSHSLALEGDHGDRARIATSRAWKRDIAEIDSLTTELLDYAKLERGAPTIRLQEVPAEPVAGRRARRRAGTGAARPHSRRDPRLDRARIGALRAALHGARTGEPFCATARAHARSAVSVSVLRSGERTVIQVDDDGCGIRRPSASGCSSPSRAWMTAEIAIPAGFGLGLPSSARSRAGTAATPRSAIRPLGGARVSIVW